MILAGDADFASNSFFPYLANSDAVLAEIAWLAHHMLTLSWTLLGLLLLIVSWVGHAQDGLGPRFWPAERRA